MHSTENTKTTNTKIIFPNSAKIMGFQLQCCFLRTQTHTHEIHSSSPNFTIVHQPVRKNLPGFIDISNYINFAYICVFDVRLHIIARNNYIIWTRFQVQPNIRSDEPQKA